MGEEPDEVKGRAKVEHVFQVMKLKFGFVKVRYRDVSFANFADGSSEVLPRIRY